MTENDEDDDEDRPIYVPSCMASADKKSLGNFIERFQHLENSGSAMGHRSNDLIS